MYKCCQNKCTCDSSVLFCHLTYLKLYGNCFIVSNFLSDILEIVTMLYTEDMTYSLCSCPCVDNDNPLGDRQGWDADVFVFVCKIYLYNSQYQDFLNSNETFLANHDTPRCLKKKYSRKVGYVCNSTKKQYGARTQPGMTQPGNPQPGRTPPGKTQPRRPTTRKRINPEEI